MRKSTKDIPIETLRSYSRAFSRSVFRDIIEFEDFSHVNWLLRLGGKNNDFGSYLEFFSYLYSLLKKQYRCEYFYKNEIITQYIIKNFGTKNSILFNEFRVGDSIVDLAMMNGESKAFEIKTDYDSPKRLLKQLEDYHRIFNKVYLVVSCDKVTEYLNIIPDYIGVLTLDVHRNKVIVKTMRDAISNMNIDCDTLMQCLRISEYKNIVYEYYQTIPEHENGDTYDTCLNAMKHIPNSELNQLFLKEIKKRKTITQSLPDIPSEFRQMCLSLNLSQKKLEFLFNKLTQDITDQPICISRI